jgi:diguanylate cyclase (GGDEF)-like protein
MSSVLSLAEPKYKYRHHILGPLLAATVALVISIIWLFGIVYQLNRLNEDRVRIEEARLVIEKLARAMVDAETGQRGYLITNNASFLEPYQGAQIRANAQLDALQKLSDRFPQLKPAIPRLQELVARKFQLIASTLQVQLNAGSYAPHLRLTKDQGQIVMADIRRTLDEQDRKFLKQERTIERKTRAYLWQVIAGAVVLLGVISSILFYGYRRITHLFESSLHLHEVAVHFEKQACHDAMTGIPNLRGFEDNLRQMLAMAQRSQLPLALFYLDLDGFKAINDQEGHDAGDEALIEAIRRFRETMRDADFLARLGGDEFAIIVHNAQSVDQLKHFAQRLNRSLEPPIRLSNGNHVQLGVSIGVARFPEDGVDTLDLVSKADRAMYYAKGKGKNQSCFAHQMDQLAQAAPAPQKKPKLPTQ